jgi:hypothetical protein
VIERIEILANWFDDTSHGNRPFPQIAIDPSKKFEDFEKFGKSIRLQSVALMPNEDRGTIFVIVKISQNRL